MDFPMLADCRFDQVTLQLTYLTEHLCFVLDFLRELCQLKASKKAMHGGQRRGSKIRHLGHHLGEQQSGMG